MVVGSELTKNKIVELALNLDSGLLELLLSNDLVKRNFFAEVGDIYVFDKHKFHSFVSNKQFLPDSYTTYRNKIGLQASDSYISESDEVVLAWPYKDCLLSGNQSKEKEKEKRSEFFFNEILASDEIDVLLEPKVFTNFKRFTQDGERDATSINANDNLIIKGNNLFVIHCLKRRLAQKVKLIYIDPPYNTGGDYNIFTYNNSFNHSTWLTFMKNRLSVAKDLLRDDGFIAIAINHSELLYLGVLADEIFGRENRAGIISVKHHPAGKTNEKFFATTNEYMLVYVRDAGLSSLGCFPVDEETAKKYKYEDEFGKYCLSPLIRKGETRNATKEDRPNQHYAIYVKDDLSEISRSKNTGFIKVLPIEQGKEWVWSYAPSTLDRRISEGRIVANRNKSGEIVIKAKKYLHEYSGKKPTTTWLDGGLSEELTTAWESARHNATNNGTNLLKKMFGSNRFSYPKSLHTVQDIVRIATGPEDIILDFFAGSGTTGHAVLGLNKEDGGNRKFILVEQLDEHIDICRERIQIFIREEDTLDSFVSFELAQHNEKIIHRIMEAKSKPDVDRLWDEIRASNFISYRVDPKVVSDSITEFRSLPLEGQKKLLFDVLDKNQIYINYSDIDDEDYEVPNDEKAINSQFYGED